MQQISAAADTVSSSPSEEPAVCGNMTCSWDGDGDAHFLRMSCGLLSSAKMSN